MPSDKEIPSYILSELEDLTSGILDVEELILAMAAAADRIDLSVARDDANLN